MPDGHRIYRGQEGLGVAVPESRADFAARITAFYGGVAERNGWVRAPVTEALHDNISLYIGDDGHHLNAQGAAQVSAVLWDSLRGVLPAVRSY